MSAIHWIHKNKWYFSIAFYEKSCLSNFAWICITNFNPHHLNSEKIDGTHTEISIRVELCYFAVNVTNNNNLTNFPLKYQMLNTCLVRATQSNQYIRIETNGNESSVSVYIYRDDVCMFIHSFVQLSSNRIKKWNRMQFSWAIQHIRIKWMFQVKFFVNAHENEYEFIRWYVNTNVSISMYYKISQHTFLQIETIEQ